MLSGINRGANIGRAVLHSGTVGAALTGALHGARAMAVSLDVGPCSGGSPRWSAVRPVLLAVLPLLLDAPPGTTVNVNVPDRPVEQLAELRRCRLGRFGVV